MNHEYVSMTIYLFCFGMMLVSNRHFYKLREQSFKNTMNEMSDLLNKSTTLVEELSSRLYAVRTENAELKRRFKSLPPLKKLEN